MKLDDIKTKRLAGLAAKFAPPQRIVESSLMGVVGMTTTTSNAATTITFTDVNISEGKERHTPEFVRHCVAAITSKPETLDRVQEKKDGSPFGICYASYKQNKRSLAAKHSKGAHHTEKQYEKSLATLRKECEELRANRPSRRNVVFEAVEQQPQSQRRGVRFELRG